ncbi:glycosyltransferase [Streptomyces sp. NBC_01478]|uniref:glycosyltransferase n=1 Tax=Streptomyces sp. NBC_01478 TaxID=2903882 RepID=UPI002E3748C9|nr:glycosyltransferase [Streptomyces sp. NBC_01478]
MAQALARLTVWHINTTAVGGGVADLLEKTVGLHNDSGLRARWLVLTGEAPFFAVTKRLHHRLHGTPDPFGELGPADRDLYEDTTLRQAHAVLDRVAPGDLCVLHDPQTLGLAPHLAAAGLHVVWRCHIGTDTPSEVVRDTWSFLDPYLQAPARCVFSAEGYAPPALTREEGRVVILRPSIDPATRKNRPMTDMAVHQQLRTIGLEAGDRRPARSPAARTARIVQDRPLPADAPLILQVSRWDPLKDMAGVLRAFTDHIAPARPDTHLVLAGPEPSDIPDDPEGAQILGELHRAREPLDARVRGRVHLVTLSLRDAAANADSVNALQRRADVVVQKSLQEGFGLTVTEAMWKSRAIVASAVGGIPHQIRDGFEGTLVPDPHDLSAFGRAVLRLLSDPGLRARIGTAAHRRCTKDFLIYREFLEYCSLYVDVLQQTWATRNA